MGELHLDVLINRMLREFNVDVTVGRPGVAYLETITRSVRQRGRFVRQTGGHGQFGDVTLDIEPLPSGGGFVFEDRTVGGTVPRAFVPAVERGVREAMEKGVLASYPMVDLAVSLVDGGYHEVDSSDLSFKIAGSMALKEGALRAGPVLLEPIMKVVVMVPDDLLGDVTGNLGSRRAEIQGVEARGTTRAINAMVPLSEMFGYVTVLRSLTHGRGTFTMEFDHYSRVRESEAVEIIRNRKRTSQA
jgi:elongation factor G